MSTGWNREDKTLTTDELNFFRNGSSEDRGVINGLKVVFCISWGAWILFLIVCLIQQIMKGTVITNTIAVLVMFIGLGIVFEVCIKRIKKRKSMICQTIEKGEYELILSKITKKDYRIQGSGKAHVRIDFYLCSKLKAEISPCTRKQYKTAQVGDNLRVVVLPSLHMNYGFLVDKPVK